MHGLCRPVVVALRLGGVGVPGFVGFYIVVDRFYGCASVELCKLGECTCVDVEEVAVAPAHAEGVFVDRCKVVCACFRCRDGCFLHELRRVGVSPFKPVYAEFLFAYGI